ncbi:hypothetical protein [Sporosarcina sp. HYO08]|uniref:hypothetical protein n=1 Tax=Sporosarcina sp. HYO08 TaxID=1759557 RepID=UPI00079687BD|nr:hypothetical protein [Sporosarcina sp. HYO08]KXH83951.1 hypothetical protein AU377_04140 [Sporosarcina sp. HYO08]
MRNAIDLGSGFIATTDNSGGIGEKTDDIVHVTDEITAQFATRVALLEQWAAGAEPISILIHNFSGKGSWPKYVGGVTKVFEEAGLGVPSISGSTETNMSLLQSALAVTIIGRQSALQAPENSELHWFTYGVPLVGEEVLTRSRDIASLRKIKAALDVGIIQKMWPIGSGGIKWEAQKMLGESQLTIESPLNVTTSGGPATVVLLGMASPDIKTAKELFNTNFHEIKMYD